MTRLESHVLGYWYKQLRELTTQLSRPASSGELARHVGTSRSTAKKYLLRLIGEGHVETFQVRYPNGLLGQIYAPTTEGY